MVAAGGWLILAGVNDAGYNYLSAKSPHAPQYVNFNCSHARAYRVVLLDAGHLCQTFCLVATWLGLAPFCTAAMNDTLIEDDLKIDGISESALYVAGVGFPRSRPATSPGLFPPRSNQRVSKLRSVCSGSS